MELEHLTQFHIAIRGKDNHTNENIRKMGFVRISHLLGDVEEVEPHLAVVEVMEAEMEKYAHTVALQVIR